MGYVFGVLRDELGVYRINFYVKEFIFNFEGNGELLKNVK